MDLLIAINSVTLADADGPPIAGTPQYATNGDAASNVPPTIWPAYWFNMLLQELVPNLIEWSGIVPSSTDTAQVRKAIQTIIQKGSSNYTADTSAVANSVVVAYTPAITTLVDGQVLKFSAANANSGPSTITINGLGALPLVSPVGTLQGGEISVGGKYAVCYNAATESFILVWGSGGSLARMDGRLISTTYLEVSQNLVWPQGAQFIEVEGVGGGGAAGGSAATDASQYSCGASGGAGQYGIKTIAEPWAGTIPVTIGAGGVGAPGSAGGNGGSSVFGTYFSLAGGIGGASAGPSGGAFFAAKGGAGGSGGAGADFQSTGMGGSPAFVNGGNGIQFPGPSSQLGMSFGGGASGGSNPPSAAAVAGGNGEPGIFIVRAYA